ncbi:MAG TPA: glycosyltransferase [Thermoplasmata archaeon]|nr:glycosyltransferase [Thermoplasmata archaeon]
MGAEPAVAVVIGAYRRTAFVEEAVRSVLAQRLPRERFELVVVKGFEHPAVDRFLAEAGVPAILDPEPRIGRWLLRGVSATRAPLVAFLDDDDAFEPDRLERVLSVFDQHPHVGFYRNRVRVVDRAGAPVPPERWRTIELDAALDASGPTVLRGATPEAIVEFALRRTRASFNSSTMVVRRRLLEGEGAELFGGLQLPDLTLLVLAAVAGDDLFLDDRRLTRYRVSGENVTGEIPWLAQAAEAHARLGEFAQERGRPALAHWLYGMAEHYDRMYRGGRVVGSVADGSSRRTVAHRTAEYLRFLGTHPAERAPSLDVWASALYGLGAVLSPGATRRVLAARPTARGHRPLA